MPVGKVTKFDKPGVPFEIGEFRRRKLSREGCSSRTLMR